MADFLTEHRNALEKRLKELRPLYDEYLNLERVKDALQGVGGRRPGFGGLFHRRRLRDGCRVRRRRGNVGGLLRPRWRAGRQQSRQRYGEMQCGFHRNLLHVSVG